MPSRSLDATFFVQKPPDIRFQDGLFHVSYQVGKIHAEFVMLPKTFATAMLVAQAEFAKGQIDVLPRGNVCKIRK